MISDYHDTDILEVYAHDEQWSFVNGGAEVCSIILFPIHYLKIVCLRRSTYSIHRRYQYLKLHIYLHLL
jgi:hypothetical protein